MGEVYLGYVWRWCCTASTWVDSGWRSGAQSVNPVSPFSSFPPSARGHSHVIVCGGEIAILLRQNCTEVGKGKPIPSPSYSNDTTTESSFSLSSVYHHCSMCNSIFILVFAADHVFPEVGGARGKWGIPTKSQGPLCQADVTSHHPHSWLQWLSSENW